MKANNSILKRFLPYYRKHTKTLSIDLICASLTTICELILPLIVRFITNKGIEDISSLSVKLIFSLGGLYLFFKVIDVIANYYMASIGHVMGAKIETDMRTDIYSHMQKLSFSYYDETKIGQLMARITSDLFDVTEFAHHCPEEIFIAFLKITVSFIILCYANVYLTLIIFIIVPIMVYCCIGFNKKMKDAFKESRVQIGELNSQVEDSLLGVRVVKSFANEKIEEEKFHEGNIGFLHIKKHVYKIMAAFQSSVRAFDGIMYIAVVIAGSLFMIYGKITPGDLVAYLMYVTTLLVSVKRIVEFAEQFQKGITGIERFFEVIDTPIEISNSPNAKELKEVNGNIEFKNVNFQYSLDNEKILSNINLKINKGESVALIGPSGAGKTTLCSLIPRFYDVSSGEILLDDINIKNYTLESLRNKIGVVQQDVYLFSGSVYENIEYGSLGSSLEEIIEAAKKAGAHEFIEKLPNGYNTYVGERGVKLSGGQKQRISIARVFLKNPPILILDEATSALDNESERLVQKSLEDLTKGRTTLTIAHRLTTIRNSNRILVLTKNGIEEEGNHKELIDKKGIYYNLYNNLDIN